MRLIYFTAIFFLSFSLCSAQQWLNRQFPVNTDAHAVVFLGPLNIVAAGGNSFNDSVEYEFVTTSAGFTWNTVTGNSGSIQSLVFSDTLSGFGVGLRGNMIKTADGGNTWWHVHSPLNRSLYKVAQPVQQTLITVGGSYSSLNYDSVQTILRSVDGGNSWSTVFDQPGMVLKSVYFTSNTKGFAVGDTSSILTTANGGLTWQVVASPIAGRNFEDVTFVNAHTGYIVGGCDTSYTILQTLDGGTTWTVSIDAAGPKLNGVAFLNPDTGYAVGDFGQTQVTFNQGFNWSTLDFPFIHNFNGVSFYKDRLGAMVSSNSAIELYTSASVPVAITVASQLVDSTTALFTGGFNQLGWPGDFSFEYGTDSNFAGPSSYHSLGGDTFYLGTKLVANLIPDTTYYFRALARNTAGYGYGNILSFYTGVPKYTFRTSPATLLDSMTVQLNGVLGKLPDSAQLWFEYGLTQALGTSVIANPPVVYDTLTHNITATIHSLIPCQGYFFRISGITNNGQKLINGDILTFFTGKPYLKFEALPGSANDTIEMLNGFAQGFALQADLSFQYDTTLRFNNSFTAQPRFINDTGSHYINGYTSMLAVNHIYYYRIRAITAIDTFYSDTIAFFTGNVGNVITGEPTQISGHSAHLNGTVEGVQFPLNIQFEYGSTPALGSTIAAAPALVTDTGLHQVSASLSGLAFDSGYYFRLKGFTTNGISIYGEKHWFFTGDDEIPNWNFQFWQTDTIAVPYGWNIGYNNFERVPGHSGNYALKLNARNYTLLHSFIPPVGQQGSYLPGGVPFDYRPDSIIFYEKASIAPGDSAFLGFGFKSNGVVLGESYIWLTQSDSLNFKRISYPVPYLQGITPDSLIIAFSPTNLFTNHTVAESINNYLIVDDISFLPNTTPVYNGNFETWYNYVYEQPLSWYFSGFLEIDSQPVHTPLVTKTYFSQPDDYAIQLKNTSFSNIGLWPCGLSLTDNRLSNYGPTFPIRAKHLTLNGYYKYYPVNRDSARLTIDIFNGTGGRGCGHGEIYFTDSVTEFQRFEVPILYYDSLSNLHDSADIIINNYTYSGAKGESILVIDKLSFDGFSEGLSDASLSSFFNDNGLKIYPNPAKYKVIVELKYKTEDGGVLQLYNLNGQTINETRIAPGENKVELNTAALASGFYLVIVKTDRQISNGKIAVVK